MDLPSRTHWRVEVRLPPDRAVFETNVLWDNPTPLEQPYYNWMTAAAFARDDLVMSMPGTAYLAHSGERHPWPVDDTGRFLPAYTDNRFGSHKSYHVVGELHDFFGGYYRDVDYGFGHWSRYEEMPGQKLWLWALSREGGVWEDLLTDTDGQYVEFQAGRLFVQYSPGVHVNPITQAGFEPGASDRWSETWFPVEGLGGLTDASRLGAMYVHVDGAQLTVSTHAFGDVTDTLRVTSGNTLVASIPIAFSALDPVEHTVDVPVPHDFRVELPNLDLEYATDRRGRALDRPFTTDERAWPAIPEVDRWVFEARELVKSRRYHDARVLLARALAREPWHREALLGQADLEYRRGRHDAGLTHALRALQLDAYDARANFIAGMSYRALGSTVDAREALGWAARSVAYRAVAYVQLAEILLAEGETAEAARYARLALEFDQRNLSAWQVLAMVDRHTQGGESSRIHAQLVEIDPLTHFVAAERYLAEPSPSTAAPLTAGLRSEYPDQTILELAIDYARRGAQQDARRLLGVGAQVSGNPLLVAWRAWLADDPALLPVDPDVAFVFPYRRESLPMLEWAMQQGDQWSWAYLLALNLWAVDRADEALTLLEAIGDDADFAPFYVSRAHLRRSLGGPSPEVDLRRAVELAPDDRTVRIHLIRYLQTEQRWTDALAASGPARARFPGDFNLDLLHVQSQMQLDQALEAIEILSTTHVLPSENARTSHRLWEWAHTAAALDALESGRYGDAQRLLRRALEWPEHLGQGRPYEPEERLQQYLLGVAAQRMGNSDEAVAAFEAVVEATDPTLARTTRLDILVARALEALGRETGAVAERVAPERASLGNDPESRLISRALTISP
jgi:tetratricopeptide (TPR) repeat protein